MDLDKFAKDFVLERRKKCSINDKRLSAAQRDVLKVALYHFADEIPAGGMSRKERREAMVELYENGFLRLIGSDEGIGFEPCYPEDAPQLHSPRAFEPELN